MFLIVRLIKQTQEAIETGEAARSLLQPRNYIRVSNIDKIDQITDNILQLAIYKVLPQIQPDVEALLQHSLKHTLQESNFYQGLQKLPGMEMFPVELTEQIADNIAQATYDVLASSYADEEGRELFDLLTNNFQRVLRRELQNPEVQSELQPLLCQLLEELKINYVQGYSKYNPEITLAEADQILQTVDIDHPSS